MKTCGYCGQENGAEEGFCGGCGTSLTVEAVEAVPVAEQAVLTAGKATLIFLGSAMVEAVVILICAGLNGNWRLVGTLSPAELTVSRIMGGVAMVLLSWWLVGQHLQDASVTGAAWTVCDRQGIFKGLGMGVIAAWCGIGMTAVIHQHVPVHGANPTSMAFSHGLSRLLWLVDMLCVAPITEELLFRGVLYGGYRRSFGPGLAAVVTTVVFVVLHGPQIAYFWPVAILLTGFAALQLWLRLRWASVGPPIATHFGFNAVMALARLI
jgi:membrane protease YdiL (CAAX protease family)